MERRLERKLLALLLVGTLLIALSACRETDEPAFGGESDVAFAEELLPTLEGRQDWPMTSEVTEGGSPHGAYVRLYSNVVEVDGEHYHVIVKDNYGGEGATVESVSADPDAYYAALTVMVQREPGYDPDHEDWFYAKYGPTGEIDVNPNGIPLAGRVGKGADSGCIPCHASAGGGDYLFRNDP